MQSPSCKSLKIKVLGGIRVKRSLTVSDGYRANSIRAPFQFLIYPPVGLDVTVVIPHQCQQKSGRQRGAHDKLF